MPSRSYLPVIDAFPFGSGRWPLEKKVEVSEALQRLPEQDREGALFAEIGAHDKRERVVAQAAAEKRGLHCYECHAVLLVGQEHTRDGAAFCADCTACGKAICTHYSGEMETWHDDEGDAFCDDCLPPLESLWPIPARELRDIRKVRGRI